MSEIRNHYDDLKVTKDAPHEVIRGAYKHLSRKYHPDKNPDNKPWAEEMMKIINHVYRVLSDPQKRKIYDESIKRQESQESAKYQAYKTNTSAYEKDFKTDTQYQNQHHQTHAEEGFTTKRDSENTVTREPAEENERLTETALWFALFFALGAPLLSFLFLENTIWQLGLFWVLTAAFLLTDFRFSRIDYRVCIIDIFLFILFLLSLLGSVAIVAHCFMILGWRFWKQEY